MGSAFVGVLLLALAAVATGQQGLLIGQHRCVSLLVARAVVRCGLGCTAPLLLCRWQWQAPD